LLDIDDSAGRNVRSSLGTPRGRCADEPDPDQSVIDGRPSALVPSRRWTAGGFERSSCSGSPWYVTGAAHAGWDDDQLHDFHQLHGSDFEVVDTTNFR